MALTQLALPSWFPNTIKSVQELEPLTKMLLPQEREYSEISYTPLNKVNFFKIFKLKLEYLSF